MPSPRLPVAKTYKMFIGGAFPRSESGRSFPILDAAGAVRGHSCRGSRKDLRDAVSAARKAFAGWSGSTAYLRAQILYRMAEMLEGKRAEFVELLTLAGATEPAAGAEVDASIERLVHFAGWADKFTQVLGRQNPVAGPYWNISVAQPMGVVGVVCPADAPLLALVSLLAPVLCAGNTAVLLSPASAPVVSTFGEVCATCDLPGGVANLITGGHDELLPILAKHRDVEGILAAGVSDEHARTLREGAADNLKRITIIDRVDWTDRTAHESAWRIEPLVEIKTVWHPVGS